MERTLVLLKPDCIQRGLMGEIISRIENKNFRITAIQMLTISRELAYEHYHHIRDLPVFEDIIDFMISGSLVAMVVEGQNVIQTIRLMMGPTNCFEAPPGSIRGDYASHRFRNLMHASDSPESAEIEIKRFFQGMQVS